LISILPLILAAVQKDPEDTSNRELDEALQSISGSLKNLDPVVADDNAFLRGDVENEIIEGFLCILGSLEGMLNPKAFHEVATATDYPLLEAMSNLKKEEVDQTMIDDIADRDELLQSFQRIQGELKLHCPKPSPQPAIDELMTLKERIFNVQSFVNTLRDGLHQCLKCSCDHAHGTLLFVESHLQEKGSVEKHTFRMMLNEGVPDESSWRESTFVISLNR
jgi:hypothetical protein